MPAPFVHSHQQCLRVLGFPHPRQYLFISSFFLFNYDHPSESEWYFIVVLICISIITNDVEHLFMCLSTMLYLLWRNIKSFAYFLLDYLSTTFFLLLLLFGFWFFLPPIIFISWRLITLQYCSGLCHTLTRISHGCTCVPHPEPLSHLPPHPIPLGHPSAPAPSTCLMHILS